MKKDILLLSALSFILFMLFAQAIPILDGDSAFYATIAKNMLKTGDWLTLRFISPSDIIDKPPLAMWLTAISFKIFGINEFAISLWQSLLAVGCIVLTYLVGKELFNKKTGFLAALILMTSAQFFYITRTPMLDIPLVFFITLAFYGLYRILITGKPGFYYLTGMACALGLMTKGPIAVAIPVLSFLIYLTITKKFNRISILHALLSTFLFIAIAAPWFIVEYRILGQRFADIFFSRNLLRFMKPTDVIGDLKQIAPQYDFYSYFLQIFILFAPWSGFVYPAVFYSFKRSRLKLTLIWAAAAFCLFAFSLNYKIGRYILPAFPALSIIIADFLMQAIEKGKELRKHILVSAWLNTAIVIPLLTLGTIFLFVRFPAEQLAFRPIALPFLTLFSIGIILGTILLFADKLKQAIIAFTVITVVAYITFITSAALFVDNALPTKAFCLKINQLAKPTDIVVKFAGEDPRQEYFYLNNKLAHIKDLKELKLTLSSKNKVYGITQDKSIINTRAKILDQKNGNYLFTN